MALSYPTLIPGLRSPFDQVKGIVYFGRMLSAEEVALAGGEIGERHLVHATTVRVESSARLCESPAATARTNFADAGTLV